MKASKASQCLCRSEVEDGKLLPYEGVLPEVVSALLTTTTIETPVVERCPEFIEG